MNNHTPGPWAFDGRTIWAPGDNAVNIANMIGKQSVRPTNAAFIVRACNAHEELLTALQNAKELLRTAQQYFPKSIKNRDTFHLLNVLANSVDPAIAKAEGRA